MTSTFHSTSIGRRSTLVALVLATVLAACGGGETTEQAGADEEATAAQSEAGDTAPAALPELGLFCGPDCRKALELEADPAEIECSVGIAWNSGQHEFGAATIVVSEQAAESFPNMELIVTEAGGDAARDANNVEDLITRGVDVIIVSPNDSAAIAASVGEAIDAGIDVISSDRTVEGQPVTTHIGSSNYTAGLVAGRHAVELLDGSGRVVEIQGGLGSSPQIDREGGFHEAISGTDIEVIAQQTANWDRAEGLSVVEDVLQRFPEPGDVDLIYTQSGGMAEGAALALEEAGRADEIHLVSVDGRDSEMENIQAGLQDSTVMYPLTAKEHVTAAAKLCAGEELPEHIELESHLITPDNVDRFMGTRLGVPAEELGL